MTAVLKEIKKLNLNKATQDSYIPVKVFLKKMISLLITFISNLLKLQTHQILKIFLSLHTLWLYERSQPTTLSPFNDR